MTAVIDALDWWTWL